jgi:hypothetical protein
MQLAKRRLSAFQFQRFSRVLKNCVSGLDPALRGFCKCSHIVKYAALSKTPRAWADGPILVFRHPVRSSDSQGGILIYIS